MKKVLLFIMMFTLTLFFGNTTNVSASDERETFYWMNSGDMVTTNSYGTSPNSRFRVAFFGLGTASGGNPCTTTLTTKLMVRSRSVAGAKGSTVYATTTSGFVYGYNSFYYGDEDIYLEVTLLNINGDCNLEIGFDVDQ